MKTFPALLTLTLLMGSVYAQTPLTSDQAYEYLQSERGRADKLHDGIARPPADSLKKAEQILRDALTYYYRPDIQKLAQENKYLLARKGDILFDLSAVQIKQGKLDEAVESLRYDLDGSHAAAYIGFMERDSTFALIRKNPYIAAQINRQRVMRNIFDSNALKTSYQPNLSDAEKVAGLSKLWSEAKYNFAYFDQIPDVNWDSAYLAYIPKVQATRNTVEYYRTLKQFYALLRDGHTDVWVNSGPLADSVYGRPPLSAQLIEGRVFIQQVRHDSLMQSGITPGLEITRVDNVPVVDYANRFVRPYQSGSTTQNVDVQTYNYNLLRGPKDRPVSITFRDRTGREFSRMLPRSGYSAQTPFGSVAIKILPGNVAYVQLNEFDSNKGVKRFTAAFDTIANSNALILDVRQNGGGNSGNGWNILSYLTDKEFGVGSYKSRLYSPVRRARGENVVFEEVDAGNTWSANKKKQYTKPVVVLTSGMTFSAAEDFCVAFDAMKRGKLMGEPTGGSTGQPLSFALPGGLMARVCTKRDMYPDGTEWVGKGIQPDILVNPTVADVQAGRDTVLEAALAYLNGKETGGKDPRKKTK